MPVSPQNPYQDIKDSHGKRYAQRRQNMLEALAGVVGAGGFWCPSSRGHLDTHDLQRKCYC